MSIQYGVLTGDIIHSTMLSHEHRTVLNKKIEKELKKYSKLFKIKSELYRGDSFQCLVFDPKDTLRIALLIKTFIRNLNPSEIVDIKKRKNPNKTVSQTITNKIIDARIAIGISHIEHQDISLANSHGEAFILSGHALDSIKNSKQTLTITTSDEHNDELQVESLLLDTIMLKNTAFQSAVINLKLRNFTEIQIAKALGIMQSAVNQRSTSANWNAINYFVNHFEKLYTL